MPNLDGISTIKILKNNKKKIPIIMMSSDNITLSGIPFIQKPFLTSKMISLMKSILSSQII